MTDEQRNQSEKQVDAVLQQRFANILKYLSKQHLLVYALLAIIIFAGFYIRIQNVSRLVDETTGDYMPADPDALAFFRYAQDVLEHGSVPEFDSLRYYPYGYHQVGEFSFLAHTIVWLYRFLHMFNSDVTLGYADIIYPPIAFAFALLFFFLFVRRIFDSNVVALFSTALLAVNKAFLFRTMSGISDKEALAVFFFFLAFYLYTRAWQTTSRNRAIFFGLLSGFATVLTGLVWGGANFIFLILGIFAFVEILFNRLTLRDYFVYASWYLSSLILLSSLSGRFTFQSLILSTATIPTMLAFLLGAAVFLIHKYYPSFDHLSIHKKIPKQFVLLVALLAVGGLVLLLIKGPSFYVTIAQSAYEHLVQSIGGTTRWGNTVAESRQPYFVDWFGEMGKYFVFFFLISSVFLFHHMTRCTKRYRIPLTVAYSLFIFFITFTRYSPSSFLNGQSTLSLFLYFVGLVGFCIYALFVYLRSYISDKENYQGLCNVEKSYVLILIHFIVMVISARSAIRLVFVLTPVASIFVGYFFYRIWSLSDIKRFSHYFTRKHALYALRILVVVLFLFYSQSHAEASLATAAALGSTYHAQWQQAMSWVRENTPEDAVFAHWWDYGYLIQTGARRATLSDGGNSRPGINFYSARYLMTAQNDTDVLEFLKSNNATHVLFVGDDIGKYPAYSSIGSDVAYDRYSWLSIFGLDASQTQETRNGSQYVYTGSAVFDEDITYDGKIFPALNSGVGAFILSFRAIDGENGTFGISQPHAIAVHNGQQTTIPLTCMYMNGRYLYFDVEGLPGCLRLIPSFSGGAVNPLGGAIYLSGKTKDSFYARRYIFDDPSPYFELVYDDSSALAPLMLYHNQLVGPLKIWEVHIPPETKDNPFMRSSDLPDERLNFINAAYV